MINEKQRAEELLDGVPFKKEYFFSAYLVIARYYNCQGLSALEIRQKIEEWEKKYDHTHYFDLNKLIMAVINKNKRICEDFKVYVSRAEVRLIKDRFDNKVVRKLALALLCLAKFNKSAEFSLSLPSLAQFTGVSYNTLKQNYLHELISFGYIEKVPTKITKWGWDEDATELNYKQMKIRVLVDFGYDGEYMLDNNDISTFYQDTFSA